MPPTLFPVRMEQGGQEGEQERSAWEGQVTRAALEVRQSHRAARAGAASLPTPTPWPRHLESPRGPEGSSWGNDNRVAAPVCSSSKNKY